MLSADGRRVPFSRTVGGNTDLWIAAVDWGIPSRFTNEPPPDICPVWSPDGRSIAFSKGIRREAPIAAFVKSAVTDAEAEPLLSGSSAAIALDWSRDGRFVLYRVKPSAEGSWDLWAMPAQGERVPLPVAREAFDERGAQFSPDGRWIAFESNSSGEFEIYVRPFPGPGASARVSSAGGAQPRWRGDGNELFYVSPDGQLMTVPLRRDDAGGSLQLGTPQALFDVRVVSWVHGGITHEYDVSADGRRFLVNTLVDQPVAPISLILNRAPRPR